MPKNSEDSTAYEENNFDENLNGEADSYSTDSVESSTDSLDLDSIFDLQDSNENQDDNSSNFIIPLFTVVSDRATDSPNVASDFKARIEQVLDKVKSNIEFETLVEELAGKIKQLKTLRDGDGENFPENMTEILTEIAKLKKEWDDLKLLRKENDKLLSKNLCEAIEDIEYEIELIVSIAKYANMINLFIAYYKNNISSEKVDDIKSGIIAKKVDKENGDIYVIQVQYASKKNKPELFVAESENGGFNKEEDSIELIQVDAEDAFLFSELDNKIKEAEKALEDARKAKEDLEAKKQMVETRIERDKPKEQQEPQPG